VFAERRPAIELDARGLSYPWTCIGVPAPLPSPSSLFKPKKYENASRNRHMPITELLGTFLRRANVLRSCDPEIRARREGEGSSNGSEDEVDDKSVIPRLRRECEGNRSVHRVIGASRVSL